MQGVKLAEVKSIPYNNQLTAFFVLQISSTTTINLKFLSCKICKSNVPIDLMRSHVACHMLTLDDNKPPSENLCGFCGTLCGSSININKGTGMSSFAVSNCDYSYKLSLQIASKSSKRNPSTNCPIICKLCKQVLWLYNMECHFLARHSNVSFTAYKEYYYYLF